MMIDHNFKNYLQAVRELPGAIFWLIIFLLAKINIIYRMIPEDYAFKVASAPATMKDCTYNLFNYRNPYSKITYALFVGLILAMIK